MEFVLLSKLICEICVSKAKESPWNSMGCSKSGLSGPIYPVLVQPPSVLHLHASVKYSAADTLTQKG